jgi:hypothetical protein
MSTQQKWYLNNRIVFVEFAGELSVDDIVEALETSINYVERSDAQPVHFLHDWTQLKKFPTNILQIRRQSDIRLSDRAKLGWMVAYGNDNRLMRYISQTVTYLFDIRFRMFSTREEALRFLHKMDDTLSGNLLPM